MDFKELRTLRGTTPEELAQINKRILALASETKRYSWEEKIDSLIKLAKAAGAYIESETGTDYNRDVMFDLREAYDEFCEWRHEEPYVVDEIKDLLDRRKEYTDVPTGVRLIVEKDNPGYPDHPLLTLICPEDRNVPLEEINAAIPRLLHMAGLSSEVFPPVTYKE